MVQVQEHNDERRKFKRIHIELPVQFIHEERALNLTRLINISANGAAVKSDTPPEIGTKLVAYIESFERMKATVVRHFQGGFAVQFAMNDQNQFLFTQALNRLVEQLESEVGIERRRAVRDAGPAEGTVCRFENGDVAICKVLDISFVGANLLSETRPQMGEDIILGKNKARVTRITDGGFAVEFVDFWSAYQPRACAL